MNALLLPLSTRTPFTSADAAVNRTAADTLDFAGARIHLATESGLLPAWYLGVKPRGDAMVKPLGRSSWIGGRPNAYTLAHARRLMESGVSVLLVDVRRHETWWARLCGRSVTQAVQAAVGYLVDRGHGEADCVVDGW